MNSQDTFEDRLLNRLKHAVDERPTRRGGRRLFVAGVGVAATAALGIGIPTLTAGTATAYEITQNGDSLVIEIKELSDADGLEEALAEYGYKADVTYLPFGKKCAEGRFERVTGGTGDRGNGVTGDGMSGIDGKLTSFKVELTNFDRDHTLVIELGPLDDPETDRVNLDVSGVEGVAAGEVGECEVEDVPAEFIRESPDKEKERKKHEQPEEGNGEGGSDDED